MRGSGEHREADGGAALLAAAARRALEIRKREQDADDEHSAARPGA